MVSTPRLLVALLTSASAVYAEYAINQNTVYASAGACAQYCAEFAFGYNDVMMGCDYSAAATCLCDQDNGHSSSMDVYISLCPQVATCGGAAEATKGMQIFGAYCSMNLKGVSITSAAKTSTAAITSNPTAAVTAAVTGVTAQATTDASQPTTTSSDGSSGSSSSNSSNDNNNSNTLSMSDKIAIGCAIGGAIITIAVAVPAWIHMRNKKKEGVAAEAQPLHPPQMANNGYYVPVQQPLYPPPQPQPIYWNRPSGWTWQSWR